jgi:hypothetical protein
VKRHNQNFADYLANYPRVTGELETLRLVLAGRSIARYGDGEFKIATHNTFIKSQRQDDRMSARLRSILHDSGDCLVGIPNIHDVLSSPLALEQKKDFWAGHIRFHNQLNPKAAYVSSFISRPDSAPWINTDEYWDLLQSLWIGQDITVVGGSGKSLKPEDLEGAREITHVQCPKQHAFAEYDEILKRIGTPKRALICLGPTATVLAVDLCKRGVHAIDMGHVAMFLRKRRRGEPMWVSDDDKAVDRLAVA